MDLFPILERFGRTFIPLFIVIDPIGLAAVFLAMSQGVSVEKQKRIANQATWTGGLVALLFLFLGRTLFATLGITVSDFQIAGGLILFILATRDITHSATEKPAEIVEDFGVVPLGMPLIAGPASITTLLLLSEVMGTVITLVALVINLGIVVLTLAYSRELGRRVGQTGLRAISKIISLLLAAIAVNMIRHGLAG